MVNKLTIDIVIELCNKNNWTCLDKEYINNRTKMSFKCNKCNFIWQSVYNNVRNSKGCFRCIKGYQYKYTFEEVKNIVDKKGFICLENEYINNIISMNWQCKSCDYKWKTSFGNINREKVKNCPKCNGHISKYTLDEVKKISKEKNLECLNIEYKNSNEHMDWKCLKCNRIWKTSFGSILESIGGCVKCSFKERVNLNLDIVNETIKDKSFVCLSNEYTNNNTKMIWKCNICSNEWDATFHHIKDSNSGCPNCASFKTERLCRQYFQSFMGYNFPTKRLKCLEGLELDGYCEELNLAFEYDGEQHSKYHHHYHNGNPENFFKQQERDILKEELCKKNSIELIRIPHTFDHKNETELEDYILQKLIETKNIFIL